MDCEVLDSYMHIFAWERSTKKIIKLYGWISELVVRHSLSLIYFVFRYLKLLSAETAALLLFPLVLLVVKAGQHSGIFWEKYMKHQTFSFCQIRYFFLNYQINSLFLVHPLFYFPLSRVWRLHLLLFVLFLTLFMVVSKQKNSEASEHEVGLSDDVGAGFISGHSSEPAPAYDLNAERSVDLPPADEIGNMGVSKVIRADQKRFFFDLGSNNRGHFLRISEVRIWGILW